MSDYKLFNITNVQRICNITRGQYILEDLPLEIIQKACNYK